MKTLVKKIVPMFALGMGYQAELPKHSFFQTLPSSEEVLSESLEERENIHPVDALKTLPGVVLAGSEVTTYTSSVFLRGASSDHTLFFWNDFRSDDFTAPAGATDPFGFASEFSNQIHVLKGPQSLLYGTQALGGVVLIDDDPDQDSTVGVSVGSLHTMKAQGEARSDGESFRSAIGGTAFSTEGLSAYNSPTPQGSDGSLERDGRQQGSVSGLLAWQFSDHDELQVMGNSSRNSSNDDVPPTDDVNAKTDHRAQQWKVRYKNEWQSNFKSLFLLTSQDSARESANSADSLSLETYKEQALGRRWTFLNRNSWNSGSTLWHFGFEGLQESGDFFSESRTMPATSFHAAREEQSLYLVNDWTFPRSDVSWGVRGSCQKDSDCVGVYQLSGQWHWPDQQRSLFGIVSTGLKRPTLYQLYSSYGDLGLKSEMSQAFEVGVLQRQGLKNRVKVSFFQNRFQNLIDYNFTTNKYLNLNKTSTSGVELLQQFEDVFFDSEFSLALLSAKDESTGLALLRRPSFQASWIVGWNIFESFRWFNEFIYIGERTDTDLLANRVTLSAVKLWNTGFVYKTAARTQYFLRVNNLGNSFYEDIQGYLTPGRFYWAGVKTTF